MWTFKQQFLAFFLFSAVFSACDVALAETAGMDDGNAHHGQTSIDWPGMYRGFLPCDDCKGVKTTLALNKNNTYILITQHIGKSEREFVEKGKFASDDGKTIVLTPRNTADSPATRQYLVGENLLTQLDGNGNRMTGKFADRYVLRRTVLTEKATSHSLH
jgi:uncharacterized lipoprotein NlpE involved in copper resistance